MNQENPNRIPTSYKDKNGKEIFVNDIVKVTYGDADHKFSEYEKVILKDGVFYLDHDDGISTFDSPQYSLEVTGTIHKEPLLFTEDVKISFFEDE